MTEIIVMSIMGAIVAVKIIMTVADLVKGRAA